MINARDTDLLEARFVEMEPAVQGFSGVLVEIRLRTDEPGEERYLLTMVAVGSGERIFSFASRSRELAYAMLERELRAEAQEIAIPAR